MAINFNGTSQYLERTANLPTNGAATICGWFRISATPSDYDSCLHFGNRTGSYTWGIGCTATVVDVGCSSAGFTAFGTLPTSGQAMFMAMVLSGTGAGGLSGYQRLENSSTFLSTTVFGQSGTITALTVGTSVYDGTDYFPGAAWNIKVWDRALTSAELLVESYYKRVMFPTSLNCHWPLRDSSDLYDYSGNGRNPTAIGSPTSADDAHGLWVPKRRIFLASDVTNTTVITPTVAAMGWV